MSIAIDIAWDRPSVAEIKATGAVGVLRYFSTDSTKNLTAAEVAAYHAAGLATGDVWETTTGRATQGYQAGIDDATAADGQRKADGLPSTQAIYLAVDEDTDWASVAPYFNGAAQVLGQHRVGVYGGYRVIEGAYAAGYRYLWQTLAWSGGQVSAHAVLYQDGRTVLSGNADINQVRALDWGQYPRPAAPKPPTTAPAPTLLEELMLAYLPPIAANVDTVVPVEPAGTTVKPGGAAGNAGLWLCLGGGDTAGTVAVSMHTAKGWGAPASHPVGAANPKVALALPVDGSVDLVRLHPTVPLLGYVVGRQVA